MIFYVSLVISTKFSNELTPHNRLRRCSDDLGESEIMKKDVNRDHSQYAKQQDNALLNLSIQIHSILILGKAFNINFNSAFNIEQNYIVNNQSKIFEDNKNTNESSSSNVCQINNFVFPIFDRTTSKRKILRAKRTLHDEQVTNTNSFNPFPNNTETSTDFNYKKNDNNKPISSVKEKNLFLQTKNQALLAKESVARDKNLVLQSTDAKPYINLNYCEKEENNITGFNSNESQAEKAFSNINNSDIAKQFNKRIFLNEHKKKRNEKKAKLIEDLHKFESSLKYQQDVQKNVFTSETSIFESNFEKPLNEQFSMFSLKFCAIRYKGKVQPSLFPNIFDLKWMFNEFVYNQYMIIVRYSIQYINDYNENFSRKAYENYINGYNLRLDFLKETTSISISNLRECIYSFDISQESFNIIDSSLHFIKMIFDYVCYQKIDPIIFSNLSLTIQNHINEVILKRIILLNAVNRINFILIVNQIENLLRYEIIDFEQQQNLKLWLEQTKKSTRLIKLAPAYVNFYLDMILDLLLPNFSFNVGSLQKLYFR